MPIYVLDKNGDYQPARTDSSASLLVLSDEITPDEIQTELGLTADRWWLRGEFDQHPPMGEHPQRANPHSGWEISSRLPKTESLENHLGDLLDQIGQKAPNARALAADPRVLSVRVWLSHFTDNGNPGFAFSDGLLRRTLDLGVGIDLSVWFLGQDDEREGAERPPRQHLAIRPGPGHSASS